MAAETSGIVAVLEPAAGAALTAEVLGVARRLGNELSESVTAVVLGAAPAEAEGLWALGADRVVRVVHPILETFNLDAAVNALESLFRRENPNVVLMAHTFQGRALGPALAFRLQTGVATDCVDLRVEGEGRTVVLTRSILGGNFRAEVVIETRPQVVTLRPKAFPPAEPEAGRTGTEEEFRPELDPARIRQEVRRQVQEAAAEGVRLEDARIVVAGGRGLGGPENWYLIEELAKALGAAVGASRAVTDAGWVPTSLQVGLTGKTISPDLYIAVGISGAVQHMAGVSAAKTIVAINKDPDATIFKYARFGVVGDAKQILPALTREVKKALGKE
ncbi:MAG: electron transfer flavoprotein subunit alpha [Chloroflexota bacterium]